MKTARDVLREVVDGTRDLDQECEDKPSNRVVANKAVALAGAILDADSERADESAVEELAVTFMRMPPEDIDRAIGMIRLASSANEDEDEYPVEEDEEPVQKMPMSEDGLFDEIASGFLNEEEAKRMDTDSDAVLAEWFDGEVEKMISHLAAGKANHGVVATADPHRKKVLWMCHCGARLEFPAGTMSQLSKSKWAHFVATNEGRQMMAKVMNGFLPYEVALSKMRG